VRRPAPRRIGSALEAWTRDRAPQTVLARAQAAWPIAVGAAIAAETEPVAERAGTLTVACRSAVWAAELELLGPELIERLNAVLGASGMGALTALRVRFAGRR